MKKTIWVLSLILILFLIWYGCEKGKKSDKVEILLYTSIDDNSMTAIEQEFESQYPNIDLQPFRLGTSKIIARLNSEIKAGKIKADMIWTADPAYFERLKREKLIIPYVAPVAKEILPCFVDSAGYYVGARVLSMGLMYNTRLVPEEEAPKDWKDLLDPKWKDHIVHANPLYSGAATAVVTALKQKYEWEYYEGLRRNGTVIIKGQSGAASKVAIGEHKVGVALDYTVRQMTEAGSPIKFVYPESGSVSWGSPISILRDSENPKECKVFIDFVLSLEGQKFLAEEQIVSVNSAVASPPNTPAIKEIMDKTLPINWEVLVDDREEILNRFMTIMME